MKIQFRKLNRDVALPKYATDGSAGFDLVVDNFKKIINHRHPQSINDTRINVETAGIYLFPNDRLLVGTGLFMSIPDGYELQIRSRSGNALKKGLVVLNSPGTIDSDYRGEIGVILINHGGQEVEIKIGDKIAQAVLTKYEKAEFSIVEELPDTKRGEGGFGHTGQ